MVFLSLYSQFFKTFFPSQQLNEIAFYIAICVTTLFSLILFWWFYKNREEIKLKNKRNYYLVLFLSLPLFVPATFYFSWQSISEGAPAVIAKVFNQNESVSDKIIKKEKWGRRDRRSRVFVSRFKQGIQVTRTVYNRMEIGKDIKLSLYNTSYGTLVEIE
jgi:hypothetical protein